MIEMAFDVRLVFKHCHVNVNILPPLYQTLPNNLYSQLDLPSLTISLQEILLERFAFLTICKPVYRQLGCLAASKGQYVQLNIRIFVLPHHQGSVGS